MAKRKASPRIPEILRAAGFTASGWGGVERRIKLPNGHLDLTISEASLKSVVTTRKLVDAVAYLAFLGGQKSRQTEVNTVKAEVESHKRSASDYKAALDNISKLIA